MDKIWNLDIIELQIIIWKLIIPTAELFLLNKFHIVVNQHAAQKKMNPQSSQMRLNAINMHISVFQSLNIR